MEFEPHLLNQEDDDADIVEAVDNEEMGKESLKVVVKTSYDVKLRELLRNIHSAEIKISSEASKEFIRLLRSDSGGEVLHQYVQASPLLSELMEAWKLRQGKPGMMYVLSLISVLFDHPDGKYKSNDVERITISRRLDKIARSIIETKLEDIYTELKSKEAKRQNAALSLMAAVVRRGVGLATEVARSFDFKLPGFPKLSEYQQKKAEKKGKHSTRRSFIEFSMSFLEVGNPRLLRWILQQKDMYSGVLRGLGSDDDDTVVYVLSILRDRVLTPESLVPPGLRSVLFGSVTLDQLIVISGNQFGGPAADIAHKVLVMVCTDPCNGLMPVSKVGANPLKGNPKRLLDVMKKLKATEITCHRELLLGIVTGSPLLGSAYMDEFPYSLEPRASATWLAAISLATDLVSSAVTSHPFSSLPSQSQDPPTLDSLEVQCTLKCIIPRAFSRMVINRGLLHSDAVVKHGSLRLLLEALKSLAGLLAAIDCASTNQTLQRWLSLKKEIQDEARVLLPDPQVLLKLLSSLGSSHSKASKSSLKRERKSSDLCDIYQRDKVKRLKSDVVDGDFDILISGISTESETALRCEAGKIKGSFTVEELDHEMDFSKVVFGIWGLNDCSILGDEQNDVDVYFHSKLLDTLTLYIRTMPIAMERSFDFFKLLPVEPLGLPIILQQSLLQLLVEHIGWSPGNEVSTNMPELMYKHLQPFINLLMFAPVKGIKDQSLVLAREAMSSTGAFDRTKREVDAWFLFLPGYNRSTSTWGTKEVEVFRDMSAVVVSFLCDAVSTIGNSLYKYLDIMRSLVSNLKGFEVISPDFSPLVICVLQKCLRLLDADSKTFQLYEKTMISLYVCNTLGFLLQTQVEGGLLSAVIELLLTERFEGSVSLSGDSRKFPCEWRPLKLLFLFAKSISQKQACNRMFLVGQRKMDTGGGSLVRTLDEVKKIIKSASGEGLVENAIAFSASIICATPDEIVENFPSVLTVSHYLLGTPLLFLLAKVFLEPCLLVDVAMLWPRLFSSGLEMVGATGKSSSNNVTHSSSVGELLCSPDFDSPEAISLAFSFFLEKASFYALFPAVVTIGSSYLPNPTKVVDMLLAKIYEGSSDDSVASLRLLLFWVYQIQSSLRTESSGKLEQLLETCFIIIKNVLERLLVVKPDTDRSMAFSSPISAPYISEVVEIIFHHPVVVMSLSRPFCYTEELGSGSIGDSLGDFLSFSKQWVHPMDHHILNVLTTVCDYLSSCSGLNFVPEVRDAFKKLFTKAFGVLSTRLFLGFREKFDMCLSTKTLTQLVPTFYIFHSMSHFISPFQSLELVHWILSKADWDDPKVGESFKVSALSVGIYIATCAFDMLSSCLYQPSTKVIPFHQFWDAERQSFDVTLLDKIYCRVVEFATSVGLDCADLCLLKAVNAVHRQKNLQPHSSMLPLTMELSRVVTRSPLSLLSHCVHRTSKTRAKLLFLLTEVSTLHLSHFGQVFFGILNNDLSVADCRSEMCHNSALSDEEFLMLLPTVLSYFNSSLSKFGKHHPKQFENIISFYSRILLSGFLNWKSYVSMHVFIEDYDELLPSSAEELLNIVNGSLLGKAITVLQYYFSFNKDSMRTDSTYLHSGPHDDLLDCDNSEISTCSINTLLNLISRIIAKISFSRVLLFPEDNVIQTLPTKADGDMKEGTSGRVSKKEERQKLKFLNVLVNTWHRIVRITSNSETSNGIKCLQLVNFLEAFVLRSIFQFTEKMQSTLVQLQSLHILEQFTRLCLLHRFEDPATMNVLCGVLTLLSGGNFPFDMVFELLLGHSQFVPTILWTDLISDSSGLSSAGTLLRPISSILKSFSFPYKNGADRKSGVNTSTSYQKKLAVVKLLRVLYHHLETHQDSIDSGKDFGVKSRELLSLLLSCYRATLGEVDLEILNLMNEIESIEGLDCGNIAEMDYLWGSSALKVRSELALEKILSTNNVIDCETIEEHRRRQFRENLPIDPKLCVKTMLYFPFDRSACDRPSDVEKFRKDNLVDTLEMPSTSVERILRYDPVFILRFSIHALSMDYIEPMEFAALGLLGIAFVSISSPDEGMRKLGYEVLGRFKNALENSRNRKEGLRLQLLLTYLQNGIEEAWQKIPSLIGVFAAEASFILLDPSHEHYVAISKHLMRSPRVNLKSIPLFRSFFCSSSVNFKGDRMWVLRLSSVGLNLDDDAQIFKRKCIVENLMGFYASSLSDYESREVILQIVKKSIKSQVLACYLVEYCGLISWLSSIISFSIEMLHGDLENHLVTQLTVVLEVTVGIVSFRNVTEWLQKYGLEQLAELSFKLLKLLAAGIKWIKQNVALVNLILQILVSTFRASQKRKIYQPHVTLSFEGLFQLILAITDGFSDMESGLTAEIGLQAILMSTPPIITFQKDREKFLKLVTWAICATQWSSSMQTSLLKESEPKILIFSVNEQCEDTLMSKFLRWITASVILERVSTKSCVAKTISSQITNVDTLQALLDHIKIGKCEPRESRSSDDKALAAMILYLLQLLGSNCGILPSVISALCLLLLSDASTSTETELLASLCSQIRCPAEAKPSWRWTFYQPWKDLSSELTDLQKLEEHHACQALIVICSNALGVRSLDTLNLSYKDLKNSGLFLWERNMLGTE